MKINPATRLRLSRIFLAASQASQATDCRSGLILRDAWYDARKATYERAWSATPFSPPESVDSGLRTHTYKPRVDTALPKALRYDD